MLGFVYSIDVSSCNYLTKYKWVNPFRVGMLI